MSNSMHAVSRKRTFSRLSLFLASARPGLWPSIVLSSFAFGHLLDYAATASLIVAFVLCMVASIGFLFNDICDRIIDKINYTRRWSVQGPFDMAIFGLFVSGLFLTFVFLHSFLSSMMLSSLLMTAFLVLAYSVFLKRVLLLGNLVAAGLSLTPGILIFLDANQAGLQTEATGGLASALALLVAALLFMVAREVRFDEFDRIGDAAGNRITLPLIFGATTLRTFYIIVGAAALTMLAAAFLINPRYNLGVNATVSAGVTTLAGTIMLVAYSFRSKTVFYKTTRALLLIIPASIILAF